MIKELEVLDMFPTLSDEELLEVNGGTFLMETGGWGCGGSISIPIPGFDRMY